MPRHKKARKIYRLPQHPIPQRPPDIKRRSAANSTVRQKMMRCFPILLLAVLSGCAGPSIRSSSCGGFAGTYRVPKGWEVRKIEGPSRVENMIQEIGRSDRDDPGITVNAYCRFNDRFPRTQQGCAESYLDGIHDVDDDSVQSEIVGSVSNPHHGDITLYRFHSEWYGDHLVAMIVADSGYATVELWADSQEQREKHFEAFREFVKGIELKLPNKASLSTPAPPPVQSVMIIQPSTHSRSLALGQV